MSLCPAAIERERKRDVRREKQRMSGAKRRRRRRRRRRRTGRDDASDARKRFVLFV